jgi:hypothetical protein
VIANQARNDTVLQLPHILSEALDDLGTQFSGNSEVSRIVQAFEDDTMCWSDVQIADSPLSANEPPLLDKIFAEWSQDAAQSPLRVHCLVSTIVR